VVQIHLNPNRCDGLTARLGRQRKLRDLLDMAMREPSIVAAGMRRALDAAKQRGLGVERCFGGVRVWKDRDAPLFVDAAHEQERYSGSL